MQLFFASFFARLSRLFPKQRSFRVGGMSARFFVPFFNHYVTSDLIEIKARAREPYLYQWLDGLEDGAVLFDVGTSYGQESVLASSKDITVVGFDCSLVGAHLCALNKRLNDDRFRLVVAAVAETSGQMITITTNSDTHIPSLHKKNVPYSYEVSTLALDDFARANALAPTHLKIDVDGAEMGVLKGAASLLGQPSLREVFIEIEHGSTAVEELMAAHGFAIKWEIRKTHDRDILFERRAD